MRKVYISSTYKDHCVERRAALEVIAKLKGTHGVAMERYTARPGAPLDECLRDVQECDYYVGIVSWRYGFIPTGHEKSITELEYEAAEEKGIPLLLFLSQASPPWWGSWTADRRRAHAFRRRLAKERLCSFFADPSELSNHLVASLANELLKHRTEEVPPLLPYEVDRTLQVAAFERWLAMRRESANRPLVAILHGPDNESLEKLLERLLERALRSVYPDERVRWKNFGWPNDAGSSNEEHLEILRYNLTKATVGKPEASAQDLQVAINAEPGTLVLSTVLLGAHWQPEWEQRLDWYLSFLESIPPLRKSCRLLIALMAEFGVDGAPGSDSNRNAIEAIERIAARHNALRVPRLGPVPIGDVLNWLLLEEVREWSGGQIDKLRDGIENLYGKATEKPMREVGQALYRLLQSCQATTTAS